MSLSLAAGLDAALKTAGIPIEGVSIGSPVDRATWTVQFLPAATAPQRATAAQIVSTFDPADPAVVADQQSTAATATSRNKDILTTVAWAVRRANIAAWNLLSPAQKKTTVLAEADNWRDLRVFIEQNL